MERRIMCIQRFWRTELKPLLKHVAVTKALLEWKMTWNGKSLTGNEFKWENWTGLQKWNKLENARRKTYFTLNRNQKINNLKRLGIFKWILNIWKRKTNYFITRKLQLLRQHNGTDVICLTFQNIGSRNYRFMAFMAWLVSLRKQEKMDQYDWTIL